MATDNPIRRKTIEELKGNNKFLFNNELTSDVTFLFECEGEKIKKIFAHSWVLSNISTVFCDTMNQTDDKKKLILVVDHQYEDFIVFLKHFYDNDCVVDVTKYSIWCLCEKYSVPFIKQRYIYILRNTPVSLLYALHRLELALNLNIENEMNRTSLYIGLNILIFLNLSVSMEISREALKCILSVNKIKTAISEEQIFTSVMKWAAYRCKQNEWTVNSVNKRRVLGNLIKLIRFPLMTLEQFSECVKAEEDLLSAVEKNAILMQTTTGEKNKLGFNSISRVTVIAVLMNTSLSIKRPKQSSTIFKCNKLINIDTIFITIPRTHKNKVTIKFYNKDEKLFFVDVQMVDIGINATQNYQTFTLKRSVKIFPNSKYTIDIRYKSHDDIFAFNETLPQEVTGYNVTTNFSKIRWNCFL